ncbi:MAG: Globin-coupled histidine kinase [Oscillochloris sp.]|nr:Globin-coupled histidine kinase [Oscillochloris sp.]
MSQDRKSWHIKDEAMLTELVQLMNLSDAEVAAMGALQEAAKAIAPEMTKVFYERLFAHGATAEYLQNVSIDRLHGMVQAWFAELFCGYYDAAYAHRRMKIGEVHVKIGLPVRYPLAMLDVVMPYGESVSAQHTDPALASRAFRKVLSLDVAIFNQAYEDNQLRHLADLVGGERLARRLLTGA